MTTRLLRITATFVAALLFAGAQPRAHTPHDAVFDVALPDDHARRGIVFALVRGCVFRSEDGGATWRRLIRGLDHKHTLFSLDVAEGGRTLFLSSLGDGVYRSTDGGESWSKANHGLETSNIDQVLIAEGSPDVVLASGTTGGLFLTRDGGASWRPIAGPFGKVTALAFLPERDDGILVGDVDGGLHVSENAGATWRALPVPEASGAITSIASAAPESTAERTLLVGTERGRLLVASGAAGAFAPVAPALTDQPIVSVALSPDFAADGVAFAVAWDDGVFCSRDGAATFEPCASGLTTDHQSALLGRPSFGPVRVSPGYASDRTVFVGGFDGLFKSTDGGRVWEEVRTLSPFYIVGMDVSPAYAQDSTVMLTNLLWGAYLSHDAGRTWEARNDGVLDYARGNGLTRLFAPVFSPNFATDRTVFTSTWYRLLKSTDAGASWRQILPVDEAWWAEPDNHGMSIALSPDFAGDGVVFMGTHRGRLFKSTDRGETFSPLAAAAGAVGSIVVSPGFGRDQTVFVGDPRGVRRSADGGATWTFSPLTDPRLLEDFEISPFYDGERAAAWLSQLSGGREKSLAIKLAISPAFPDDGVVFAGTASGLFRSADGGVDWERVRGTPFGDAGYIEGVAVSPDFARDGMVLVSVRGRGVFRSQDGGATFEETAHELTRAQNLPAHYIGFTPKFPPIVFSPDFARDRTVFAFSGTRPFRSTDGGEHWQALEPPAPRWIDRARVWYLYNVEREFFRTLHSPRRLMAIGVALLMLAAGVILVLRHRRRRPVLNGLFARR